MKNRVFFSGAIILIVFNLLGKIVGSFYRITLATIIGGTGMGQYQLVFPLYLLMLTISTSGVPVAISKMVAEFNAKSQYKDARKLLKISILILSVISFFSASIIVLGAKSISAFQGNSDAYVCYYGIAPAVVFVGILSALRGYFQGNLQMFPTAISGLIEQVGKLCFGLILSRLLISYGTEYAVFGALLGISASELLACVFLFVCFLFKSRKKLRMQTSKSLSVKFLSKSMLSLAVPVTLGGLVSPITSMVDSFLVVNLLMFRGNSSAKATALLGLQAGIVEPLVNLPVTISVSLAVVLLPSISKLMVCKDTEKVKGLVSKVFEITLSISICCAVCYVVFGRQALSFLYGRNFSPEELSTATKLLFFASLNIIFLSLVQISSSVLQGLGESKYTVKSLLIGCTVKIALEVVLLLSRSVGIYGAVISGGVCYFIVLLLNYKKLSKLTGFKVSAEYFYVSVQSCLVSAVAFVSNWLCLNFLSESVSLFVAGSFTVAVFATTYFLLIAKRGSFRQKPVLK